MPTYSIPIFRMIKSYCFIAILALLPKFECSNEANRKNLCLTPECINIASYLLKSIDFKKNPCDDFYQYACGKWMRKNPIPDTKSVYGTLVKVREDLKYQLRSLLEDTATLKTSKSADYAKHLYQSCMKKGEINALKTVNLRKLIENLGGWPMIGTRLTSSVGDPDFTDMVITFTRKYGHSFLLSIGVGEDIDDTSKYVLYVDEGSLGIGPSYRDYYLNDTLYGKYLVAYKKQAFGIAKILAEDANLTVNESKIRENVDTMVEWERKLAEIMVPDEEKRNVTLMHNKWTLKQLQETFTSIDWTKYFISVMPGEVYKRVVRNNRADLRIVVTHPEFMRQFDQLIQNSTKEVVKNFMLFKAIISWMSAADSRFNDISQDFYAVLMGRQQKPSRWEFCLSQTRASMHRAVGSLYAQRGEFGPEGKSAALKMFTNVKWTLQKVLGSIDWMDKETKRNAKLKVEKIKMKVAFDDFFLNNTAVDESYKNLTMDKSLSYFETIRGIGVWNRKVNWFQLLKTHDPDEDRNNPAEVNAFFWPTRNIVSFPAGILQPPYFHSSYPKYVNYGCMGWIIAHELSHGFDDQGRQFDHNGNAKNWWSEWSANKFLKKAQCFIDQFNKFGIPGTEIKMNGINTQGENIADAGGLAVALLAYKTYVKNRDHPEPVLPALNLTVDQLFFISTANFHCRNVKRDTLINDILRGSHSPGQFRVNGAMANSGEFSRAFQCPQGSPMNPVKKCSLW